MQQVHDEVRHKIAVSNESYKQHADAHRHFVEFVEGDAAMVCRGLERFSQATNKKLHPHNTCPFKILKKIRSDAYILELPTEVSMSTI